MYLSGAIPERGVEGGWSLGKNFQQKPLAFPEELQYREVGKKAG